MKVPDMSLNSARCNPCFRKWGMFALRFFFFFLKANKNLYWSTHTTYDTTTTTNTNAKTFLTITMC